MSLWQQKELVNKKQFKDLIEPCCDFKQPWKEKCHIIENEGEFDLFLNCLYNNNRFEECNHYSKLIIQPNEKIKKFILNNKKKYVFDLIFMKKKTS